MLFYTSLNPCHALMVEVVIGGFVVPCTPVIVHMEDEQSLAGQSSIPTRTGAVLQQKIFIGVVVVVYDICRRRRCSRGRPVRLFNFQISVVSFHQNLMAMGDMDAF